MDTQYIDAADCAKMIRRDLKNHFPGIKFSVKTSKYAGGASVNIHWVDGPTEKQVDAIAQRYHGAEFDGMTDMKSYNRDILVDAQGNAKTVHFGADFVFCDRSLSQREAWQEIIAKRCQEYYAGFPEDWQHGRFGCDWASTCINRVLSHIDFRTQTVEQADINKIGSYCA